MGRLTRDAEVRYSGGGDNAMGIARFTIAVDRRVRRDENTPSDQPTADFISCVAFSRTAEFMERFGKKGVKFLVEGRIQTGSYTNKDGQRVYTTDVVVENVEFAESKSAQAASMGNTNYGGNSYNNRSNGGNSYTGGNQASAAPAGNPSPSQASADGFMNIPDGIDEELPFN